MSELEGTRVTLAFDEDKQSALFGYVLRSRKFYQQAMRAIKPEWWSSPYVGKLFAGLSAVDEEFHRRATPMELLSRKPFSQEDQATKDRYEKTIKEAVKATTRYGLDMLRAELDEWMRAVIFHQGVERAVRLYNAKKLDEAWAVLDEATLTKTMTSFEEGTSQGFAPASQRILSEKVERIRQAPLVLPYGVAYLDDALGGIIPNDLIVLGAKTGAGKCLGLGTKVLKYDGSVVSVEDVVEGDLLMGPDSKPRRVSGTTRGYGPLFRIVPVKGDPWVCNDVHVLTVVDSRDGKVTDVPVNDFLKWGKTDRIHSKHFSVGVDFPPMEEMVLDPYFLGLWLGDGAKHVDKEGDLRQVAITSLDHEVIAAVKDVADKWGLSVSRYDSDGQRCPTHSIVGVRGGGNKLLDVLRGLTNSRALIPDNYLRGSRSGRLQLLAGLIDSDGSLSHGGFEWVQKDVELARQVAFLARSLGFRVTESACDKSCQTGATGSYLRLFISGDCSIIPTRISRKKAPPRQQVKDHLRTGFKVEKIEDGEYAGFCLDGDGRFLLGDFTVTHNTQLATSIALQAARAGHKVHYLALEAEDSEIERRIKYGLLSGAYYRTGQNRPISYLDWRLGRLDEYLGELEQSMKEEFVESVANLETLYRNTGKFDLKALERNLMRAVESESRLIIVDHLHYVDTEEDENFAYKQTIKMIRDVVLKYNTPVIVIAHLRKNQNGRAGQGLINTIEDFHGTSDVPKIATTCIMISPARDKQEDPTYKQPKPGNWYWPTYVAAVKSRLEGSRTRYTAICQFNSRTSLYEPEYEIGKMTDQNQLWEELTGNSVPYWAQQLGQTDSL